MNGIIGMTGLALETDLTVEQQEYLHLAKSSADALLNIIDDILDFSKIEAGRLDLESVDFSLRGCLQDVLKTQAMRCSGKGPRVCVRDTRFSPRRSRGWTPDGCCRC